MACNGNCEKCDCKQEDSPKKNIWVYSEKSEPAFGPPPISYKYAEDKILADLKKHLDATYSEHYATEDKGIECFDAWIALGDSTPTFRNTALKYLWRYGKKNGNNKKDLMKALHYIFMCLYVDHYKG